MQNNKAGDLRLGLKYYICQKKVWPQPASLYSPNYQCHLFCGLRQNCLELGTRGKIWRLIMVTERGEFIQLRHGIPDKETKLM